MSVYPKSAIVSAVSPRPCRSSYVTPIRDRVSCGQCTPTRSARSALKSRTGCASHARIRGQSASPAFPGRTQACRSGWRTYRSCSVRLKDRSAENDSGCRVSTSPHVRACRARHHPWIVTAWPGVREMRMRACARAWAYIWRRAFLEEFLMLVFARAREVQGRTRAGPGRARSRAGPGLTRSRVGPGRARSRAGPGLTRSRAGPGLTRAGTGRAH